MNARDRLFCVHRWMLALFFAVAAQALAGAEAKVLPPGAVWFDGHAVNPARLLVRWNDSGGDAGPRAARVEQALRSENAVVLGARATSVTVEEYPHLGGVGMIEFSDAIGAQSALAKGAPTTAAAGSHASILTATQLKSRIAALRNSGDFAYVEPDYLQFASAEPGDAAFNDGRLWGLRNSGQNGGATGIDTQVVSAWDLTTGSANVIVAVIDTGIRYTHRDLATNMWRNPGETAGNNLDDDGNGVIDDVFGFNAITRSGNPLDDNGHGSHCAGTIGGSANDAGELVGVAWTVRLMGLKFLAANGGGNLSDAIRCIDYAIAKGAHIISGSYGGGGFSQATSDAIERARQAGILCIFAAGNETNNNDASPAYPASYPHNNIISVAAIDRSGALASFSNFGAASVDLAAPGVQIFSCNFQNDSAYQTISGTSMATPHVAGVAALLKARHPGDNYTALRDRLLSSTRPLPALQGRVATGGLVQARAAMDLAADGALEVALSLEPSPLQSGAPATLALRVSDRDPVTGATVTGTLGTVSLIFHDNGVAPDVRAADGTYTVRASVPPVATGEIILTVNATAPGRTPFAGSVALPVVARAINDNFAAAATLDLAAVPIRATNVDCSRQTGEPAHGGNTGGRSVWWNWTAPAPGQMRITTAGSGFDTLLGVYTGAVVNGLTTVATSDDDGTALHSAVEFTAVTGTTYRIAVDGFAAAQGDVVLNATFTGAGPANTPPAFVRQPASLRVQQGETIRLSAEVVGVPAPALRWSYNNVDLADGGRYSGAATSELVITSAIAADSGNYQLTATNVAGVVESLVAVVTVDVAFVRPPNDDFAQRTPLVGTFAQISGINTGGTAEGGEPAHAGVAARRSVWWTWTAPQTGAVAIDTFGSGFDTVLAVYRGTSVGAVTAVAANDDAPNSRQSRVTLVAEAGVQYAIAVDSYGADDGPINLRVAQGDAGGLPPAIVRQPLDVPVLEGFDGALAVAATGSAPLSYRWWKQGSPLPDSDGAVLPIDTAQLSDAGDYFVVVTNPFGSVTSEVVTVTVAPVSSPANDNFATAPRIVAGGELVVARLTGATREGAEPMHAGGGGGTMWWRWSPLFSGSATISTAGSVAESGDWLDTVLAVYTGNALNALTLIAENDDFDDRNSEVTFFASAGTTYFIAVGGYDLDDVGIVILDTPAAASVGAATPPVILLQPATVVAAIGDDISFLIGFGGNPTPAIQWQRSADGGATWGDLTDSATISGATELVLQVSDIVESQDGRLVRAVLANSAGTVISNTAMLVVLPRPVNDDFAAAVSIAAGAGRLTGGTFGATRESVEQLHAAVGSASVWWKWQAPFSGPAAFDTVGSDFDTVLAVYTGDGLGALTMIAANDDFGDSRQSRVAFTANAGTTYHVAVAGYDGDYGAIVLAAPTDLGPEFALQPALDVPVTLGGTVTISVGATGNPLPALQWQRSTDGGNAWFDVANNAAFSGATTPTLTIVGATAAANGHRFRVVATNAVGTATSVAAVLTVSDPLVQVVNLSTRALSLGGDGVIIPGFVVAGTGTKRVLVRAVGPKLQDFGLPDFLPDPVLSVFRQGENTAFAANDDWITQEAGRPDPGVIGGQVGAFPLTASAQSPTNDTLSAALVLDLAAGAYSTIARDLQDRTGIGIVEVYDIDDANTGGPRLVNVSNRGFVGTGAQVMIPGFVVHGTGARRYLVRAVGPKLVDFGLAAGSLLADPRVQVMREGVEVAMNDNWVVQTSPGGGTSADVQTIAQQIGAFSLGASAGQPTEDQQSAALIVWLEPGGYTVVVSGAGGATGIVIAEVYEVP